MSAHLFEVQTHYLDSSYIRQYPRALSDGQEDALKIAIKQYTPKRHATSKPQDITIIAAHANGVGKELYEPLWDDLLQNSIERGHAGIRSIWMADRAANGPANILPTQLSTYRRDVWPSRQEAEASFRRNKFYQTWDSRCLGKWVHYGLRELPTAVYSSQDKIATSTAKPAGSSSSDDAGATTPAGKPVTLTTTKYQEVFTFLRGNYPSAHESLEKHHPSRKTHPDVSEEWNSSKPFYRAEPLLTFQNLPQLRPPVLYIFASDRSAMSAPEMVQDRVSNTGTGIGGNGGTAAGAVGVIDIKDAGHFVPFEKPGEVAQNMNQWLARRMREWKIEEEDHLREWTRIPKREKMTFTKDRLYWTDWTKDQAKKVQSGEEKDQQQNSGSKL
ncbi:MAG: hypothetical protein Q9162_006085 [Coniocarpon cinnabarinum]